MFCSHCGSSVADGTAFCPVCGARTGGAPASAAPGPVAAQPAYAPVGPVFDYAQWGTRALGYIIDSLLIGVGMAVLYLIFGTMMAGLVGASLASHDAASGVCCMFLLIFPVATLLVGFYNGVYLVSTRGYSIGQGVVHVKVVDGNRNLLSMGTAFVRLLVRVAFGFVPLLPLLDLLWPLWDERRQTLHDKAVNCYVINNPTGA